MAEPPLPNSPETKPTPIPITTTQNQLIVENLRNKAGEESAQRVPEILPQVISADWSRDGGSLARLAFGGPYPSIFHLVDHVEDVERSVIMRDDQDCRAAFVRDVPE